MPDVDAVDQYAARRRVIEPRDQADERRLAGAGQADQGHHLAGSCIEGDVVENLGAVRVGEADTLEPDVAFHGVGVDRSGRVDGFRDHREHRAHAPGAGNRTLKLAGRVRDRRERPVHRAQIGDDDEQVANRHLALQHVHAADRQHERRAQNRDRADDDREQRLLPRDADARAHHVVARRYESIGLVRLPREALDQTHRREHFEQPLDQLRLELFDALGPAHERRHVIAEAQIQERDDGQREQRDGDVELHENREHDGEGDDRRGEREDAAHHQVLDRIGIDVDAVDGVARTRRDVVMKAERLQVLEQAAPQVVDHPLTGIHLHLRAVHRNELVGDLQQHTGDHHDDEQRPRPAAGRHREPVRDRLREGTSLQHVVDDDFERPGLERTEGDLEQQQAGQQRHPRAVGAKERQRPRDERLLDRGGAGRRRLAHLSPPSLPAAGAAAAPGSARASGRSARRFGLGSSP